MSSPQWAVRVLVLAAAGALLLVAGFMIGRDSLPPAIGQEVSAEDLENASLVIYPTQVEPAIDRNEALNRALSFPPFRGDVRGVSYGRVDFTDGSGGGGGVAWLISITPPKGFNDVECCPVLPGEAPRPQPVFETVSYMIFVDAMTGETTAKSVSRPVPSQAP